MGKKRERATITKEDYKREIEPLMATMSQLQRKCKELGVPIILLVDGLEVSGKGLMIGKLMKSLDPRGFCVYPIQAETKEEAAHGFLWRFWTKTPEKGRITILENSWYRKVTVDVAEGRVKKKEINRYQEEIIKFEQQLVADGVCIIKCFLTISEKEQSKRMKELLSKKATAWRVTSEDLDKNKHYKEYGKLVKKMLTTTNKKAEEKGGIPIWNVISTQDKRQAAIGIYQATIAAMEQAILEQKNRTNQNQVDSGMEIVTSGRAEYSALKKVDLTKSLSQEAYTKQLKELQDKMQLLHGELYLKKIPMVLAFEGWDAAGKGGAIKRLTEKMDPRGYVVHPVASPTVTEKNHHYLWRFWNHMPKAGHIAIFDRTWYGRVMVERIEGFCTRNEWERAYEEMNDMEESLVHAGAIVLKFWIHIDKEEQKVRFDSRVSDPEKQWKITEEDWRNREKWELYETAVDEMIAKTSTESAPWIIVEGNDKLYARIKVLETVIHAMEERLQ
ncbi:MAG: polyphosphate:AMP phosphotransferase [Eubacteriales bacterium]